MMKPESRHNGSAGGILSVLALFLVALLPGTAVSAQDRSPPPELADPSTPPTGSSARPAEEGALFLLLPVGAQGVATGRAMTATPTQEAAFWNPAGLAHVRDSRFLLYRGEHLAGDATALSVIFSRQPLGTFGVSYQLLDVGDQDLTDREGATLGSISVRSHVGIVSYATPIFDRVSTGVNFKVVQFRVDCRGQCIESDITATTYAMDLGLQSRPLERVPLRLGAMIAHLGPKLQVVNAEQADPLPTRVRVSGAYEFLGHFVDESEVDLWFTMELEDRWRTPGSPSLYMGTEFSSGARDVVFVRAGYVMGTIEQADGVAVGIGLRYERLELGIAKSLARPGLSGESEPVHVTFGMLF
jgi:hypothetical protein